MKSEFIILATLIAVFLAASLNASPTGFATGGGTQSSGEQQKGNPNYGVIKGFLNFVIKDNGVVINTETPSNSNYIYFVKQSEELNWTATITCNTDIKGKVKNTDADDSGTVCTSIDYEDPTAYSCSATKSDGTSTTIYRTNTSVSSNNLGCFAAKIPSGNYDIYT